MTRRSQSVGEVRVDSSTWTGVQASTSGSKAPNKPPLRKSTFVILTLLTPIITAISWYELLQLFYSGSLDARFGKVRFSEDPLPFLLTFVIWFSWGSTFALAAVRAATSARARKALLSKIREAWRQAV